MLKYRCAGLYRAVVHLQSKRRGVQTELGGFFQSLLWRRAIFSAEVRLREGWSTKWQTLEMSANSADSTCDTAYQRLEI